MPLPALPRSQLSPLTVTCLRTAGVTGSNPAPPTNQDQANAAPSVAAFAFEAREAPQGRMPKSPTMRSKAPTRTDATPAGRLVEAQLHRVLGYQLAQATIATTAVYMQSVGEPFGL